MNRIIVSFLVAVGLLLSGPSAYAQSVDIVARGRPLTTTQILDAGGAVQLPQDIYALPWGQSNIAGWTVLSGQRQMTLEDVPDERIRILDVGKGPELIGNPDFEYAALSGWTCNGCTPVVNSQGQAELTATIVNNPTLSYTVSGLTIGKTYELTGDIEPVTVSVQLRLGNLNEVKGLRFSFADFVGAGRLVGMRAQFVATATSHTVNIISNSGATPVGQVFARVDNLSLREVLTTGFSTPKAIPGVIGCEVDFTNCAAMGVDPGWHAAKYWVTHGIAKRVVLLPRAIGGTGFQDGNWTAPSGTLYAPAKAALTAALAANPFAVPVLLWVQGEDDATALWSQYQYTTEFTAMVADLRTVAGAEYMPVIVGQMVPEYVNSIAPLGSSPQHRTIDAAHRKLPALIPGVSFVPMELGSQKSGEPYHYNAAGARRLGAKMGAALWSRQ